MIAADWRAALAVAPEADLPHLLPALADWLEERSDERGAMLRTPAYTVDAPLADRRENTLVSIGVRFGRHPQKNFQASVLLQLPMSKPACLMTETVPPRTDWFWDAAGYPIVGPAFLQLVFQDSDSVSGVVDGSVDREHRITAFTAGWEDLRLKAAYLLAPRISPPLAAQ